MEKDPFTAALTGFRSWTKTTTRKLSGEPGADADELKTLLDLMRDYLGIERPADLGQGDLEEVLLRVYPRKVTVFDRADTEDTIPAVRDFLAYLAESGGMTEAAARKLERELDRIAPRFADAVMDPANWGTARSFVQAMAADGVDMSDQTAVDRWIAAYNAEVDPAGAVFDPGEEYEDDDEDIDFKDAFGLPDRLPPMRLPAEAELAGMARGAPMVGQLQALAAWLGTGRAVTENGELAGGDAAEAAAALGLGVPDLPAVGRMRDVPRLDYLWRLALDAGFIELDEDETHAVPGEVTQAWPDGDDDEVLDIWEMLFALVMGTLDIVASLDPRRSSELDFFGQGAALAVMLFLARPDGLPVAEVSEVIRSAAVDELAPARAAKTWQSWVRAHGDPARLLLDQMVAVGAVRISDSEDGDLGAADAPGPGRDPYAVRRLRGGGPAAPVRGRDDRGGSDRDGRRHGRGRIPGRDRRLAGSPHDGVRGQGTAFRRRGIRSRFPCAGRGRRHRARRSRRTRMARRARPDGVARVREGHPGHIGDGRRR